MARFLMIFGALAFSIGLLLWLFPSLPSLGQLPGDIVIRGKNSTLYLPIMTSILLSIILSVLFYIFR